LHQQFLRQNNLSGIPKLVHKVTLVEVVAEPHITPQQMFLLVALVVEVMVEDHIQAVQLMDGPVLTSLAVVGEEQTIVAVV
jgi:hypothetical protein